MGFMDRNYVNESAEDLGDFDYDAFQEGCIFLEAMDLSAEERKALVESPEFVALEAKGLIGKRTIVRLKAADDLERRETMAAFDLARQMGDPLWDKLALNRVKERDLISKIRTKYKAKAQRAAKVGQKQYIKKIRKGGLANLVKKADITERT